MRIHYHFYPYQIHCRSHLVWITNPNSPPHHTNQPPIQPSQIPTPVPTSTSNPTHHEVTNIQPPSPDYHLTNFLSTTQINPSTTSNMNQWGPSQDNTSAPLASPSPQPNNLSPTAEHISLLSMSSAQPPSPLLHQSLHLLLITWWQGLRVEYLNQRHGSSLAARWHLQLHSSHWNQHATQLL